MIIIYVGCMAWSSWTGGCKECGQNRERVGPPEINPHLTNRSLSYNSSLQFDCLLRGFPIQVLWTKDGVNIGNKSTFTIRQARLEDSGQYTCSATNSLGNKTSTHWIEVIGVSPQIIAPPIDQAVTEEYPVNFSCVASGIPTPTFVWDFNNGDLPSGIHQTDQEGESLLELPNVTKEMNGTYKCTAKNKESTTSSFATLLVYGKASAQVVPETHLTLKRGEVLTLICKVNEKTVKITWKKDGESLQERAVIDTRLYETKSKLVITELGEEDSGKYCTCHSHSGRPIFVLIELPTVEIFPKEPHSILEGGTLKLTCLFQKAQNVTWKKDGATNIQNAIVKTEKGKSNITISDTQPGDSGKYSCEAFNQAGSKSADTMVNIMARRQLAEVPSSSSLEWFFIGGPVVAVIFLLALIAYIKTRRAIGGIPYEGWSETTTMRKIQQGYRLPKPEHIDDNLDRSKVSVPYDKAVNIDFREPLFCTNQHDLRLVIVDPYTPYSKMAETL
ncbi:Hemicentin-1 [Stylophora pistillata]|uniref:Hemicentin-1 n=1 Tax=Stylophora pistillata TaxID=50429 RepID=A0A2B4RCV7_STYPI|nr:Hemicentin-1 [Stylophora pistillata]